MRRPAGLGSARGCWSCRSGRSANLERVSESRCTLRESAANHAGDALSSSSRQNECLLRAAAADASILCCRARVAAAAAQHTATQHKDASTLRALPQRSVSCVMRTACAASSLLARACLCRAVSSASRPQGAHPVKAARRDHSSDKFANPQERIAHLFEYRECLKQRKI